ncbi:MAG: efflux transporter periplasmic adaptor subunit, partial [Pseudomonadota bacterium]
FSVVNSEIIAIKCMFGRLQLLGSGEYDAVMIPDSAVQTDQSDKFVWVIDDKNVVHRQRITLGPIVDGLRVVRTGLTGNANVIINGTQFVRSQSVVRPVFEELDAPETQAPQLLAMNS